MPGLTTAPKEQKAITPHAYADVLSKGPFKDELRQELSTKGYYVVKGAIPEERALQYRQRAFQWLENFGLGFDRNDESTWIAEKLPPMFKGGMLSSRVYHEQWVWDVRSEQGVVDAFAKVWGTDKLTTSFDGAAVMLHHRTDLPLPHQVTDKWEHMDQSPNRTGFFCAQGIVNLNYNGPEDGGLLVLEGSSLLIEEYFATFPEEKANGNSWGPEDWYGFTDKQQEWFFARGCKWVKVCADPGDLILWDSRGMHYNCRPSGDRDRVCTYVCMAPADLLNEKDKATKQELFRTLGATTHNPFENIFVREKEEGELQDPVKPTDKILRLAAMVDYE